MLGTGPLSSAPISSVPITATPAQLIVPYRRVWQTYFDDESEGIVRPRRNYVYLSPQIPAPPARRPWEAFYDDESEGITRVRRVYQSFFAASTTYPRVSQEVRENLVTDIPTPRASQEVLESLVYDAPDSARVSQLVAEMLIPNIVAYEYPIYPTLHLGFSVMKRPIWSTAQGSGASGREIRLKYFPYPLWEWDLTYEYLPDEQANGFTASDLKTLMGFYLRTNGLLLPFLFLDPDDNTVTSQPQGVGDGFTTVYTLFRTYGLTPYTGTEPVGFLNLGETFNVYVNGTLIDPSRYVILPDIPANQMIKLYDTPGVGAVITTDMSYYYYAKIPEEKMEFEKFMNLLWSLKKITIQSLRG